MKEKAMVTMTADSTGKYRKQPLRIGKWTLVLSCVLIVGIAEMLLGLGFRGGVRGALTEEEAKGIRAARSDETFLVTGGLGFIGSHVVELLLHRGYGVIVLDDESNGHNHNARAKEIIGDITVASDLEGVPRGVTHVVHLAAAISVAESMSDPAKYSRINVEGSKKVFDWCKMRSGEVRRVVAASSAAVYGDPSPSFLPLKEETPFGGKSPYAGTKYQMEQIMETFVKDQPPTAKPPIGAVALRFFNVYGPRQDPHNPYSGVISLFMEAASTGNDINILGDGGATRDFVYVKDVARAIVTAALQEGKDDKYDVYNVCTGKTITISELALLVKETFRSKSLIKHLDPRPGDIRASSCDPAAAKDGLGFRYVVSQSDGLRKTASWFNERAGANQ